MRIGLGGMHQTGGNPPDRPNAACRNGQVPPAGSVPVSAGETHLTSLTVFDLRKVVPHDIKLVSLSPNFVAESKHARKERKMLSDENRAGIQAEMKWSSWAPILVLMAIIALFVVFNRPSDLTPASGTATPMNGRTAR